MSLGADLLRYQDNQRFVIADFESEGLSLYRSRPWQLAYAICTTKTIESIHVCYPFYADLNVSEEAARITRFDKADYLARAEDPVKVLTDFEAVALDPSVKTVWHNGLGFDQYVWQTMRRLQGKPTDWSYSRQIVDTLALSRAYRHQIAPERGAGFTAWQYKMLSLRGSRAKGMGCSLGAMAREFEIPYDERRAHDAQYDTGIGHAVFNRLIWSLDV